MSDSINIQVNKWKNNRWGWSRSTGTAARSREQGLPSFAAAEHRSPSLSARAMARGHRGQPCFKRSEKSKTQQEGKAGVGSQHSASSLALSRALPDGAEGQAAAASVALPDQPQKQPSPWLDGSWGHFGLFSVTLEAPWVCPVLPPQPLPWISTQSPHFAMRISSPTAVPPFHWGGHNCSSHHCWQATSLLSLSTILDASPACHPPRQGWKNPCCWSLVHKASWCQG